MPYYRRQPSIWGTFTPPELQHLRTRTGPLTYQVQQPSREVHSGRGTVRPRYGPSLHGVGGAIIPSGRPWYREVRCCSPTCASEERPHSRSRVLPQPEIGPRFAPISVAIHRTGGPASLPEGPRNLPGARNAMRRPTSHVDREKGVVGRVTSGHAASTAEQFEAVKRRATPAGPIPAVAHASRSTSTRSPASTPLP